MTDKKLKNNELKEIYDKWFADLYASEETETEDVLLLLSLLGSKPLKVLEPACRRYIELKMPDNSLEVLQETYQKYIPTLQDVHKWLLNTGFVMEYEFGNYQREPISEHTVRCILYACKNA